MDFGLATRSGPTATRNRGGGGKRAPLFASVAALRGERTVPTDDVESLVYSLLFLGAGKLPWGSAEREAAAEAKAALLADAGAFDELVSSLEPQLGTALATLWREAVLDSSEGCEARGLAALRDGRTQTLDWESG